MFKEKRIVSQETLNTIVQWFPTCGTRTLELHGGPLGIRKNDNNNGGN